MKSDTVKDFTKDIQQYNLGPLWEAIPEIMNKTPKPQAEAYLWSGELLNKKLMEAAEIFTPDRGGERRAKSDHDRQTDEGHHAGLVVRKLAPRPSNEDKTAVKENYRP